MAKQRVVTAGEARVRLRSAAAYLEVADLVLVEDRDAMPGVAAGDLLRQATPDGTRLAATLRRLLDIKDEAHYGLTVVSAQRVRNAVRAARLLVDRAREELER